MKRERSILQMKETYHAFAFSYCGIAEAVSEVAKRNSDGPSGSLSRLVVQPSRDSFRFSDDRTRKAVVEMHAVFAETQRIAAMRKLGYTESLSLSRQYRSVLREVFGPGVQSTIWALFEALYLSPAANPPVFDLFLWAQQSFDDADEASALLVQEHQRSRTKIPLLPEYWKTVVLNIFSCRFSACAALLESDGADDSSRAFASFLSLFNIEWISSVESMVKLEKWQKRLKAAIENGSFDPNPNVKFLAQLLMGEKTMRQRVATVASNWWQLVPLSALSLSPRCLPNQIITIAEECHGMVQSVESESTESDAIDNVFLALFNMDSLAVLQELSPFPWIATHLTDLLHHAHSDVDANSTFMVRSFLLQEYGSSLMMQSCLWETGADYLLGAGEPGRAALRCHLERLPLDSERLARRALTLAEKETLSIAASAITSTMSRRALANRQWLAALSWALRDPSRKSLDSTVSRVIASASGEDIALLSLLDNLPDDALQKSSSLALLFNLYLFHRGKQEGNRDSALKILLRMLVSTGVTAVLRDSLLKHLIEMLSVGTAQLERSEVYDLLSFVEGMSVEERESGPSPASSNSSPSSIPSLVDIRLRLLEALASSVTSLAKAAPPRFLRNRHSVL